MSVIMVCGCSTGYKTIDRIKTKDGRSVSAEGWFLGIGLNTRKYLYDMVNLSGGISWTAIDEGKVKWSTEDSSFYYPDEVPAIDADIYSAEVRTNIFPLGMLKSKTIKSCNPYGFIGGGYFNLRGDLNAPGSYLGNDIHGNAHYGIVSMNIKSDGLYYNYGFGFQINDFLFIEYVRDVSSEKSDSVADISGYRYVIGFSIPWGEKNKVDKK
jgi:hypothetical protein